MRLSDFGLTMRKYRMSHGLTQEKLAEILNLQAKYISFLENGHRDPSPGVQKKMEKLLAEDDWGITFLDEPEIITEEELALAQSLHKKITDVPEEELEHCLYLIAKILDSKTKAI